MSIKLDGSDLSAIARRLVKDGPVKTHPASPRRIRVLFGGVYIADTIDALYVWEHQGYPYHYLPSSAFRDDEDVKWTVEDELKDEGGEMVAKIWRVKVGDKSTERIFGIEKGELKGRFRVEFKAVDAWFEEDAPILVHPKDPFKRIDTLPSTRPIRVELSSYILAESPFAVHLHETLLPCRYYLPFTYVKQELLRKSDTRTQCPYKGEAEYYDVVIPGSEGQEEKVHKDLVWYYTRPNVECVAVTGLLCFYNEKVDLWVDGEKEERPKSFWS